MTTPKQPPRKLATGAFRGYAPLAGKMLATFREKAGHTQREFGALVGRTNGYIGTVEKGRTSTNYNHLYRCIEALDLGAEDALMLLAQFARERGFIPVHGDAIDTIAIVAHGERARRERGEGAVCPECKASVKKSCAKNCAVGRAFWKRVDASSKGRVTT